MTVPATPRETPVHPGIAELKAEPPMPGHGPLWQINGRIEGGAPDDPESWGWLATVSSGWDDTNGGELAKFFVKAANAHAPLVEALEGFIGPDSHIGACVGNAEAYPCLARCARARAALKLARGEP